MPKSSVKVLTIEDPIHRDIPGAVQGAINRGIGLDNAIMLRSVLRHDPDIVLVGEIRDEETANLAVETAMTGHILLSSLHADDAAATLARLLELRASPFLIASSLRAVLAQRLARKLCSECKEAVEPSEGLRQAFVECQIEVPDRVYKAVGCDACKNIGLKGRTSIHELLVMNEELGKLVEQQASAEEIRSAARRAGMKTLREDAMAKVALGIITAEEAYLKTAHA